MKILSIFDQNLFAVKYEGESFDEFERLFDLWTDSEYLTAFFENNQADLSYYDLTIEKAVKQTMKEAETLEETLIDAVESSPVLLETLFKNLNNQEVHIVSLSSQKARKKWLRLYAIRIEANVYLITGGAIKLTHLMEDRPHTAQELAKLDKCKQYLKDNGVFDEDSFHEMLSD